MPTPKKQLIRKSKIVKAAQQIDIRPITIVKAGGSQLKAFLDFIRTQGVVGLAVGLVLGGSVSVLVKSLVDNVVMPPLGLLLGSAEGLKGLSWTIGKTNGGQAAVLHYGVFLNDFINFVVIALVVYFIVKLLRFDKIDKPKQ
ncbi:MAG: MscL family protein [Candidatus Saccharibacteria bacterium]